MASSDEPPTFFRKQLTASDIAEQVWIPKNLAHLFTASRFCLDSAGRPQADKIEVHDGRNIVQLSLKRSRNDDTKLCITHSPWSNYAKYRRLKPLDCLILAPLADGCGFALLFRSSSSSSGHSFDGLPIDVFDKSKVYSSGLPKEHNTTTAATQVPEWLLDRVDEKIISTIESDATMDVVAATTKKKRKTEKDVECSERLLKRNVVFEKSLAALMDREKFKEAAAYHRRGWRRLMNASLAAERAVSAAFAELERLRRKREAIESKKISLFRRMRRMKINVGLTANEKSDEAVAYCRRVKARLNAALDAAMEAERAGMDNVKRLFEKIKAIELKLEKYDK